MKILTSFVTLIMITGLLILSCKKKDNTTSAASTTSATTTSGNNSTTGSTTTGGTTGNTTSGGSTTSSTVVATNPDPDKFLGTKTIEEYCTANNGYACAVTRESSTSNKIYFSNFWDVKGYFGITEKVYGLVTGNSVNIPNQTVSTDNGNYQITISGSGTYQNSGLTIYNYTAEVHNGNSFTCSAKYKN